MARIRTIVFDAGGTLIYPVDPVGETYAKMALKYGVKLDPEATNEAFRAAKGGASPRKGAVPHDGLDHAFWRQILRKSLPETAFPKPETFEVFYQEVYAVYAHPASWGVFPEVHEVLEDLQDRGLDFVILSNWDNRLHKILEGLGLGEFFHQRFISAELGWEKPDPAIYRHVADVLRIDPSNLLSVGDDAKSDLDGPKKAGWRAVHIDRPKYDLWAVIKALNKR